MDPTLAASPSTHRGRRQAYTMCFEVEAGAVKVGSAARRLAILTRKVKRAMSVSEPYSLQLSHELCASKAACALCSVLEGRDQQFSFGGVTGLAVLPICLTDSTRTSLIYAKSVNSFDA